MAERPYTAVSTATQKGEIMDVHDAMVNTLKATQKTSRRSSIRSYGLSDVGMDAGVFNKLLARGVRIRSVLPGAKVTYALFTKHGPFMSATLLVHPWAGAPGFLVTGVSKCSTWDTFDPCKGAALAFMRALKFLRPITNEHIRAEERRLRDDEVPF